MENDLSLINNIQKDNNEKSLLELIERHSGMYVHIVDKYINKNSFVSRDSMMDEKDYVIYKTALDYRSDRNSKFSTYLANQTKWKCLNEINSSNKKKEVGIESIYNMESGESNSFELLVINETFDIFFDMLKKENDKRVKKILDIRYKTSNTKLVPWRQVSDALNLSIQGCINIHNKFIEKVKTQINKSNV